MESYNIEFNCRKNLKTSRPSQGYKTEKERAYSQWSGVSDYEVYYKDVLIGEVYKSTSYNGDWAYCSIDGKIKGHTYLKRLAVEMLWDEYRRLNNEK